MQVSSLADIINISPDELDRLLSLPPVLMYDDMGYRELVAQLDRQILNDTVEFVRSAYEYGLPPIKEHYGLANTVMSGYTLGNWVLGFLMYPEKMRDMLPRHARVPSDVIAAVLPELLALLDGIPAGSAEWQRALAVFSLPLIARS